VKSPWRIHKVAIGSHKLPSTFRESAVRNATIASSVRFIAMRIPPSTLRGVQSFGRAAIQRRATRSAAAIESASMYADTC
jgi:hypothetical protein